MKVVVEARKTQGSPFIPNKNGHFPFLLVNALTGERLPEGGIIDGTIAKGMGLTNFGTYRMNIDTYVETRTGKGYTNYRHTVISNIDEAIDTKIAEAMAESQMGNVRVARAKVQDSPELTAAKVEMRVSSDPEASYTSFETSGKFSAVELRELEKMIPVGA